MVPPVVVPREISMIEKHYNRYLTESDAHLANGSLLPGTASTPPRETPSEVTPTGQAPHSP
jgi:hypothetical protein